MTLTIMNYRVLTQYGTICAHGLLHSAQLWRSNMPEDTTNATSATEPTDAGKEAPAEQIDSPALDLPITPRARRREVGSAPT